MNKIINFLLVLIIVIPGILRAQAPVANFTASDTAICFPVIGDSIAVNFMDLSTNSPTSWKWYFPGASPDTSTMENPTNIYYNTGGCFTVKLMVSNSIGSDNI